MLVQKVYLLKTMKIAFLVDNPDIFAQKISELLNDPVLQEKFAVSSYNIINEHFSMENFQKSRMEIYKSLGIK